MRQSRMLAMITLMLAVLAVSSPLPTAAMTSCTFTVVNTRMTLNADCTTDETILIPNGFTLNGKGYAITAVDPVGGHFLGAVVKNGGASANIINLTIQASGLANVCDGGADRLRAILFEGASGTLKGNTILGVNQGVSGCQEGNAIEVRNFPFDGTHPNTKIVQIKGNVVQNYQKTGIVANGDVAVTIKENIVSGAGPVNYIAQNGIQVGFGATGTVADNEVSGNWYTGAYWTAAGLLAYAVDGVIVKENLSVNNQVGVYIYGNGNVVAENEINPSDLGIILWGDSNKAKENEATCTSIGIDIYGNNNLAKENEIRGESEGSPCDTGILVEKDASVGTGNVLDENEFENVVNEVVDPLPATPLASPVE